MWQPPSPFGCWGTEGGISNPRSPRSTGEKDPSCLLHGVTPRYPGMLCCQGTGKPLVLWGAGQLVAMEHHLPAKHPPCQAAASSGCITKLWTMSSQVRGFSPLSSHGPELGCRKQQAAPLPAPGLCGVLAMAP